MAEIRPAQAPLTEAAARERLVKRSDMVACKVAFIDCKMPGSQAKENYSLIGPGVTQSSDQVVNLTEPHGFSMGVAAMPPGTVNNLHVHYTAEVFMIYKGEWTFRWGADGKDGEIVGRAGDVVSIPTWIFRGFTNTGEEDGWIFSALGGDDTGGIIWHPSILQTAARYGLYLTRDNMLVDTEGGAATPEADELLQPIDRATMEGFRRYTPEQMRKRVVTVADRQWSDHALLDGCLPGHASELAPVLGYGMTEDRDHETPVSNPHGFSVEFLRIQPGSTVGPFRVAEKQVLIGFRGAFEVTMNEPGQRVTMRVNAQDLFSVPADVWRSITAVGDVPAELVVMLPGDARKPVTWAPELVARAAEAGRGRDHNGYLALTRLLPPVPAHIEPMAAE